jgi:copper chaperone CopZ
MKSVTLKVEGMHCDGCAQTIKSLISAEPGVRAATVSFKDGEARILYDPQATSVERLAGAIEKPGYRVVGRTL